MFPCFTKGFNSRSALFCWHLSPETCLLNKGYQHDTPRFSFFLSWGLASVKRKQNPALRAHKFSSVNESLNQNRNSTSSFAEALRVGVVHTELVGELSEYYLAFSRLKRQRSCGSLVSLLCILTASPNCAECLYAHPYPPKKETKIK